MLQLQADQAKKQKEVNDDFTCHIAELQQQRAQQDAEYRALQQRLQVRESAAQSSILYQSQSSPLVSVCTPPPSLPSVSYRMLSVQVPSIQRLPVLARVSQASQQKGACGAQSLHLLIPSNALPQVQVIDPEQQHKVAQSLLEQKTNEVARLAKAVQDSVLNPAEVTRLSNLLRTVGQECTHLQTEIWKNFGPHTAVAGGAASGVTLPSGYANQLTAQVLPTDQNGQVVNGQSRVAGHILDPSMAIFQPTDRNLLGSIANTDPAGIQVLFGVRPMTTQEYEAMLDPNYVADQQWECEEMQNERDELQQTIE